jgi:hypothetical protein
MASRQRLFLAPVDRDATFIVARRFRLSGEDFIPGRRGDKPVEFPRDRVNDRKLRQLYVARKLIMLPNEKTVQNKRRSHLAATNAAATKAEAALRETLRARAQRDRSEKESQARVQAAFEASRANGTIRKSPQQPLTEPPLRAAAEPVDVQPVLVVEDKQAVQPVPEPVAGGEEDAAEGETEASRYVEGVPYDTKDFLTEQRPEPDSRSRRRRR